MNYIQKFDNSEYIIESLYTCYKRLSDYELKQKYDELYKQDELFKECYKKELTNLLNTYFPNQYSIKIFHFDYISIKHNNLEDFYVDVYTKCDDNDCLNTELVFSENHAQNEIVSNDKFLKRFKDISKLLYILKYTGSHIVYNILNERFKI